MKTNFKPKFDFIFTNALAAKGNPKLNTDKEVWIYFRLLLSSMSLDTWEKKLDLMVRRILRLLQSQRKRKNLRQVFTYLKECLTVLNAKLVGSAYEPKIRIAVDKNGIPKIIPPALRRIVLSDRKMFVVTASLLAIHRLLKW